MKRIVFVCLLLAASFALSAQEHLTFKGVEINGSIESFVKQLESKGFTTITKSEDYGEMKGSFTGDIVTIHISPTSISHTVDCVIVAYNDPGDAGYFFSKYETLKGNLSNKYGEPFSVKEEISFPYSRTNNPEQAFKSGKATYLSQWKTDKGEVMLSIRTYANGEVCVILAYFDNANRALRAAEIESDL